MFSGMTSGVVFSMIISGSRLFRLSRVMRLFKVGMAEAGVAERGMTEAGPAEAAMAEAGMAKPEEILEAASIKTAIGHIATAERGHGRRRFEKPR